MHQTLGQLPVFLSQRSRPPVLAESPFVTATAGSGTASYFVDQYGAPILIRGYVLWGLLMNAGRWAGTWQSDLEAAVAALKAMRANVLYTKPLGETNDGGATDDGKTWDGIVPFTGGNPATFNDTFWQRSDYLFDLCRAAGITVFFNVVCGPDLAAGLSGFTTGNFSTYGASLAARYKGRTNLVWAIGADYYDSHNTEISAMFTAITGQGDNHLFSVENYQETTSRKDIETGATLNTGTNNADFNFVYAYNITYGSVEAAWSEASPLPVIWGDGYFDQNATADRKLMRDLVWWAQSSGARGNIYGNETTWAWQTGALASLTSNVFPNTDQPRIWDIFASLRGWWRLVPDTDSSLVTAGRGTRGDYSTTSGGTGGGYNTGDSQDGFVSAAVTADGTLAVVYFPISRTVTVTPTELAAGYTVRWVDPVSGASTPISTASTYTPSGNNSLGGADWLLIFER